MIEIDRETLNELLHVDVLTVTFTKKDGSERVMRCTLREDLLPPLVVKEGEEKKTKKINEAVMPVYDMDAKAFRSFRLDSILKVQSSPGDPNG
jgi:Fe2+ transport system protein B